MPTVGRWRCGGAGFLSALLHGLAAMLLLWRARVPRLHESVSPAPIEIELTEVARPRSDRVRPAPAADRVDGSRHESSRRASPRAAARTVDAPGVVSPPASTGPSADRALAPPSAGPPASAVDRGTARVPDLSFEALAPGLRSRLAVAPSDAALMGGAHKPTLDQLRAERERQEDAVANVEAGRADPLLYDYLRGARVRLEDEAKRIAERLPVGAGQTIRGWGRGLVQRVEELHRGDPVADRVRPDLRDAAEQRRPDLAAAYDENRLQAQAGAENRRTEICLEVAPGHDTTTTLRHASGNAALDRLALEAFARAVAVQPVPPDARTGRACYEVRISAYRAGPAPGLSCDLNLFGTHGPTCVWPLKKVTTVTSQLLSVEYPAKPGAAGDQSLLRRPR
jgi:hypothetical protein